MAALPSNASGGDLMYRRHWRHGRAATAAAALVAAAACSAAGVPVAAAAPAGPGAAQAGTVITAVQGPFGRMLVVGSGPYKGFTLYAITSDHGTSYGCTTTVMTVLGHTGSCTGPSNDANAEWPAITTVGKPVAGPGVKAALLGSVVRAKVGRQVTYAGHPLYLFDQAPGQVTGEGWDEPALPPWHGVWWVVSPSGRPQPWPEMLTVTTVGKRRVLAALMQTAIGFLPFPVYSYSKDGKRTSRCNGACARAWPPVITSGRPGLAAGLSPGRLSVLRRSGGLIQASYRGRPLYLFAYEAIAPTATGYAAAGNGNGIKFSGGVFSLVSP
jgi:predicted lipoprotein with Yx(FWY)xxD motif